MKSVLSAAHLLLAVFVPRALAGVQEVWWNITYVPDANPDGMFPRRVVGVNNTWPPPPIDIHSTDSLVVHVTNSLDQPSTLHHHGMFFHSTPWMDGALGVSECGIPPGAQFDYVVPINSSGQWGTYWVHAHALGQYVDGLRAPILIHPRKEVHSYDDEFTVVLGDWYHTEHRVLIKQFINIANPDGVEPIPDSGLIYFAQNGRYRKPIPGTDPSPVTSAVGFNENATLPFRPGKTYRLRVVNTSAFAKFFFWIDGHDMRIIEVDGTDVEESATDQISIAVAQRYSVLVTARNNTSRNWAIHANMDTDMFDEVPENLNPNITSSVTYNTYAPLTNLGAISAYHDVVDTALVPVIPMRQPKVTKTIDLEVTFGTMPDGTNHAMVNGITYTYPLTPAIFSELTLGPNATMAKAYGPSSFVLDYGAVLDLVVKNGDSGGHPFHLHGHAFQIVGRSKNYTSSDLTLNPPTVEGQLNPIRRDTVQIPSGASATLRVVMNNPGAWFFHCHIEWHLEVGLAIQLIEAPSQAQRYAANVPPVMYDHCRTLGTPTRGNALGKALTNDLRELPLSQYPQGLGWRRSETNWRAGWIITALLCIIIVALYSLFGGRIMGGRVEAEVKERDRRQGRVLGLLRSG